MYQISGVYKKFDKKEREVIALSDINLNFPNSGLIFVCGRSGSGKSTLLNLLGGLDKPSSGSIKFNDIEINKLNSFEISEYLNQYVGFVFQDFALLETMTVYENVKLSLDVSSKEDASKVDEVLKDLRIYELKDKLVTKLSAGQKQRVATARAIVKSPKVILADEPTGNLDHESGQVVLSYLKKISKDLLVIIVSHNKSDAYNYADRIITLEEGKVKSDLVTDSDERNLKYIDKTLFLNDPKEFSQDEIKEINDSIEKGKINSIMPIDAIFTNHKEETFEKENTELSYSKIKSKHIIHLHKRLLGKKLYLTLLFSIIAMIMVAFMGLCQMLLGFDLDNVIIDSVKESSSDYVTIIRNPVRTGVDEQWAKNEIVFMSDEQIEDAKNIDGVFLTNFSNDDTKWQGSYYLGASAYSSSALGTVVTNKEYLADVFEVDADELILTECADVKKFGVYITDYMADSLIVNNSINVYTEGLGYVTIGVYKNIMYINGIINTKYKEKYSSFFDTNNVDIYDKDYARFIEYARNFLQVMYSFEPNFLDEVASYEGRSHLAAKAAFIEGEEIVNKRTENPYFNCGDYEDNTVEVSSYFYNAAFGTSSYSSEQISSMAFNFSVYNISGKTIRLENIKIRENKELSNSYFCLNKTLYAKVFRHLIGNYGFIIKNKDEAINFFNKYSSQGITVGGIIGNSAMTIKNLVITYFDLFRFFAILLFISSVFIIIYMNFSTVKSRKYDIGVLKSLGVAHKDINRIYFLQLFISIVFFLIFYFIFIVMFKEIGNALLVAAIQVSSGLTALQFDVFQISAGVVFSDLGIILASSLVGLLIPILHIKFIKPINMLRSKY